MVYVDFLGPINKERMTVDSVRTLWDIAAILGKDPELKDWLGVSAVAINNQLCADLNAPLSDGDVISILPPVCGG